MALWRKCGYGGSEERGSEGVGYEEVLDVRVDGVMALGVGVFRGMTLESLQYRRSSS